ncbi:amino acid ABC transporter [Arsukibacterium sp.]|uniref:substrate-binding periplasmic protein n=1 Tax=Arsukibacterium sp. TaxID=1977258 RepID=UPI00261AD176|nr:amino acid ABC transporter [Arsukibacterium sp.]
MTAASFIAKAENPAVYSKPQVTLRFCYEDKQLLPYYAGNSSAVPANPGATIEHLQQTMAEIGISLTLVRMPWLRCLQQLADNQVDALVAAYTPEREHYTVYPRDDDGNADPSKAINTNALCLAHRFDTELSAKIADSAAVLTIARPHGYRPLPLPEHAVLVGAHSPEQALELVVSGRVDATTVTCQLNGLAANRQEIDTLPLEILQPPVYFSVGYLMFSKQFYQQYPAIAESVWQVLPKTLNRDRYLEYLAYPQGF